MMAFDKVIQDILTRHYHNHRLQVHSDIVAEGIFSDLVANCPSLKRDVEDGVIKHWTNISTPGARGRKIDLFIGEPKKNSLKPDLNKIRVCIENKSVITAHRNRDARFDDLNDTMLVLHQVKPESIKVATVMIGMAERTLNVPDRVKPLYRGAEDTFEKEILPRLSSGDQTLWDEFPGAVSPNRSGDPALTLSKFRQLPTRPTGHTHIAGYDYILFVPVFIDNVNPPYLDRENKLGINIDEEYDKMVDMICRAYKTRWPNDQ